MLRCKFQVTENSSGTVRLEPVTGGGPENDKFFAATPAGHIHLHCTRPEVTGGLAVGAEVFVDLHLAPKPEPKLEPAPQPDPQPKPTAAAAAPPVKPTRKGRRGGKAAP